MSTIPQVAQALRVVLNSTADAAACHTNFVQRRSKLTGSRFVQSLVFGWLKNPQASLEELTQITAALGVSVSPQGLDQRFSPEAAATLEQVLNAAVTQVIASQPVAIPLLQRFSSVVVLDSSTVVLPDALAYIWSGNGSRTGQGTAALKFQVSLDLCTGTLSGPLLQDGRCHDRTSPLQDAALPAGSLRLADLGYFSLDVLRNMARQGVFFLSRLQVQTLVFAQDGKGLDLPKVLRAQTSEPIDLEVCIGNKHQLPVRLLAAPVEPKVAQERRRKLKLDARRRCQPVSKMRLALADWTILVTNAPPELLTLKEALVLARARWQIELLFKLWKQHGQIDEWRTQKPWRILCEVYAKLLAMLIQHWLLLVSCWVYPDRSLVKGAQTVRSYVVMLVSAMAGIVEMTAVLETLRRTLSSGCRMNPRRRKPNAYQLLLDPNRGP